MEFEIRLKGCDCLPLARRVHLNKFTESHCSADTVVLQTALLWCDIGHHCISDTRRSNVELTESIIVHLISYWVCLSLFEDVKYGTPLN
jgi:hypothetical protein